MGVTAVWKILVGVGLMCCGALCSALVFSGASCYERSNVPVGYELSLEVTWSQMVSALKRDEIAELGQGPRRSWVVADTHSGDRLYLRSRNFHDLQLAALRDLPVSEVDMQSNALSTPVVFFLMVGMVGALLLGMTAVGSGFVHIGRSVQSYLQDRQATSDVRGGDQ